MTETAVITFVELAAALDLCMKSNPPSGDEHCMHTDANAMADPFALMLVKRVSELDIALIKPTAIAAFERWHVGLATPDPSHRLKSASS
jgi:Protein of unknown function (DUF3717)